MKLPKKIYVCWDGEGDNAYLIANTDTLDLEDEDEVGVYLLEEVKTVKVTTELV